MPDTAPETLDPRVLQEAPPHVRLEIAKGNVAAVVGETQRACQIDSPTMALILDALAGQLRSAASEESAIKYLMESGKSAKTRLVKMDGGKEAKVRPAERAEA